MTILLPSNSETFGKRLRQQLKDRGITQDKFVSKLSITKPTLVKYMNGTINPPLSVFVEICDELNVPYDYMLNGSIPCDSFYRSLYGYMKEVLPYEITTNPRNEDQLCVNYHGELLFFEYKNLVEKTNTFLEFQLYIKSKEE